MSKDKERMSKDKERSKGEGGLITQIATLLFGQEFDKMIRLLSSLPMDQLVLVTPVLVACDLPEIILLIQKKVSENPAFANRVRMIQNKREQFSHLDPIIGNHPLSNFFTNVFST